MSTAAQIAANIENAKLSTGPRTEAGKAASSRNGTTAGLFTAADFIRPGEQQAYTGLHAQLRRELAPVGLLETNLAQEIGRALWRLRRCGEVEANLAAQPEADSASPADPTLDPMESPGSRAEKIQRSVDRARAQATRLLHKSTAELRRLQTDRHWAREFFFKDADTSDLGLSDWRAIVKSHGDRTRAELRQRKLDGLNTTLAIVKKSMAEASAAPLTTRTQFDPSMAA